MSDSDEELVPKPGKVRAPNRHRFKTVAERIDEVDVDVYRRVGKVRSEPQQGASCFFQESLSEWRELNAARDWLEAERKLRPLSLSLPLLLHHKQQVVDILLAAICPESSLSLPPLFDLLVAAARDLQGEFMTLMPQVWNRFTWLVSAGPGGGGCGSDPDVLQALFSAAAGLCKVLSRHITAAITATLKHTTGLRYHPDRHVRCLAAETFGFLLRQCNRKQLRIGLRALLAEHAVKATAARAHGAGLLIAESVLGVEHGLHSKAAVVVEMMMNEDLLTPEDFGSTAAAATDGDGDQEQAAHVEQSSKKAAKGLSLEVLRVRCSAVAAAALNRLLEHTRRGHTAVLWEVLTAVVQRRLAAAQTQQQQQQGGDESSLSEAVSNAARGVLLMAQAVHYFRGSRVEDYSPLTTLCDKLVTLLPQLQPHQQQQNDEQQQLQLQVLQQQQEEHEFTAADFTGLTLSHATCQLVLGVVLGHTKEVGASKGLAALKTPAARWSMLFSSTVMTDTEVLGFSQGLIVPPSTAAAAELFAPQLIGGLGRLITGSTASPPPTAPASHTLECSEALAMLIAVCDMLRPGASAVEAGLPLLLTAQPNGPELAAAVQQLAAAWKPDRTNSNNCRQQLLHCWAGLQLLPHACAKPSQAVEVCSQVLAQCNQALPAAAVAGSEQTGSSSRISYAASVTDLLQLRGMALTMLAQLLPAVAPVQLPAVAAAAVHWVKQYKHLDYATVSATAVVLESVRTCLQRSQGFNAAAAAAAADNNAAAAVKSAAAEARSLLSVPQLLEIIDLLLPCLLDSSQKLRAAALQLLCCYDQPAYLGSGGSVMTNHVSQAGSNPGQQITPTSLHPDKPQAERSAFEGCACDVLVTLRDVHLRPCTVEAGRRWSVALERIANHIEYGRVPGLLLPALVAALIGALHIRFSPLWQPAGEALAEALSQQPATAWSIILEHIIQTQQEFTAGNNSNAQPQQQLEHVGRFDLDQQYREFCQQGYGVAAAASGSCTDAGNRLSNLLKGLAAKTSPGVLHQVSDDWVPLLLSFAAAVTHVGTSGEEDAGQQEQDVNSTAAEAVEQQQQVDPASTGSKRKQLELSAGAPAQQQHPHKRHRSGLDAAVSREGLGGLGFSIKSWRGVMMEWLGLLGALRNPQKLKRASALREAVARQLLSTDPSLQAAAIRCLSSFKLPYLPQHLQALLLQLADVAKLRNGLINIPMMFDITSSSSGGGGGVDSVEAEQQQQQQQQQQRQQLKSKKSSSGDVGRVDAQLRPGFIPLLTLVLYPKMSKRSGRLGGRGAPGSARAAVLNALAAVQSHELVPLMELLLMPISGVFSAPQQQQDQQQQYPRPPSSSVAEIDEVHVNRLIPAPWWSKHLVNSDLDWWLTTVDQSILTQEPLRRRQGFLNAFEDLLQHLGYRLQPLLPVLLALTIKQLEMACSAIQQQDTDTQEQQQQQQLDLENADEAAAAGGSSNSREEGRAIRSQCLRLLAQVFARFPATLDYNPLWPGFFRSVRPLMPRLLPESAAAAAPPLLAAVTAIASSPGLARILGNLHSQQIDAPDEMHGSAAAMQVDQSLTVADQDQDQPSWAVEGLGGQLLSSCISVLGARGCSEASRSSALTVVESCMSLQPADLLQSVLLPWTGQLLGDLRLSVEAVLAEAAAWNSRGARRMGGHNKGQKRPSVIRQLALMEQLGQYCTDTNAAASLAAALVALLTPPSSSSKSGGSSSARAGGSGAAAVGGKRSALDERGMARALGAVAALWSSLCNQGGLCHSGLGESQQQLGESQQQLEHWEIVSLLFGQLTSRDSRSAAAAAMGSLGQLIDSISQAAAETGSSSSSSSGGSSGGYASVAQTLIDLNSWSSGTLDEPDYDLRLTKYSSLTPQAWQDLNRLQTLPLLLQAFLDLRNEGDLAIRQAAAAALTRAVTAFAEIEQRQQQSSSAQLGADDVLRLLPRIMYPQCKGGLRSNNLAVRQEHAALLRELIQQMPARFPDLLPLTNKDPEQDFFLNVTHLQIHRRGRALQLLSRLLQQQQEADADDLQEPATKKQRITTDLTEKQQQQQVLEQQQQPQQQHVSARVMLDIAAPLLQQFIFEGTGSASSSTAAAAGGHAKKQGDRDREGAVADAAIDALREIARQLPWQQYSGLLQRWLKLMTQQPKKQVIRAACAVLDAFHFDVNVLDQQQQQQLVAQAAAAATAEQQRNTGIVAQQHAAASDDQQQDGAGENQQGEDDDDVVAAAEDDSAAAAAATAASKASQSADVAAAAQRLLSTRVLPVLQSQLVIDDQEVARAPVALALIKLIKLLPADVERIALPRCLTSIAGLLRSRLHSSRDAAREVLTDLALELGPEYLPTIINVLRAVLPDKGFTAHVLGFTAAALLEAHVTAGVLPGQLDESLLLLLPTLEGDLFGQVAEAKEVTAFAGKYKEAKRCRAYEAYQHLAAAVTFDSQIDTLLSLVRDKLPSATSPTVRSKLEQLLTAAARGVGSNPSVTAEGLAHWLGRQLELGLKAEEAARTKAKAAVGAAGSVSQEKDSTAATAAAADGEEGEAASRSSSDGSAHLYLLNHFCLNVLNTSLKKGVLSGRDAASLLLLDPLLPLLVRCLASRHLGTVQAALKALTVLVSVQQLPGLPAAAAAAGKSLSSLLRKVPDAGHPLAQDCFRLLGAMLRDCPSYQPPTPQIRFLLKWISADLQSAGAATSAAAAIAGTTGGGGSSSSNAGERVSGYGLLRAVLSRKLLVPEVYDVMEIVQKQMITSHSVPGRSTAAAALLQFLLDYPLSPSRLQAHVAFLLTNTAYEHETGRMQALEMIQQVLVKFPDSVVANLSSTIYLPLVTRLANETSPKSRAAVAATIKLLHKQLQQQQNDQLAGYSKNWLVSSSSQQLLRIAAAHALGLLAEVEGARFGQRRLTAEFMQQVVDLITAAATEADQALITQSLETQQHQHQQQGLVDDSISSGGVPRWQEVYYILLMFEKTCQGSIAALSWQQGSAVQQFWQVSVERLLLHPHLWVRKVAGRLLGTALAAPAVSDGLISSSSGDAGATASGVSAGAAALFVYRQFEADVVDEGLCTQAVKCLVALARHLAVQQQQQQGVDGALSTGAPAAAVSNGHAESDGGSDSEEDVDEQAPQQQDSDVDHSDDEDDAVQGGHHKPKAEVTLQGLIVRMIKLAEDTRFARQTQRLAALRWIAAVATAVGTEPLLPHLTLLLRPLYRIAEATGADKLQQQAAASTKSDSAAAAAGGMSEEVRVLSEQVLAHLRTVFGSEQLLTAYTAAREAVRAARAARKTAAARRVLLDPEAASRLKIKKGKKKSEARQRKAEERRRQRGARSSGGFGFKAAKGVGKGKGRGGQAAGAKQGKRY